MSLLMKALERAAKDRAEAREEPAAAPGGTVAGPSPDAELTLEPLTEGPSARKAISEPQLKPRSAASPTISWDEQEKAAAVLRARGSVRGGILSYVQVHPIMVLAASAAIFLLGYGIYVYLQLSRPGMFTATPPPVRNQPSTVVQPRAASTPREPPVDLPLATTQLVPSTPEPPTAQPAAPQAPPMPAPKESVQASKPAPPSSSNKIVIKRSTASPTVPPLLKEAYATLNSGQLDTARNQYEELLRNDPQNIDALLGLAAIAAQEKKTDEAVKHYMRILGLDPHHALAQAGLIAILGRADPLAAETRLKLLIAREPSAFLYFTLGNLYADQSLWSQAQQSYFRAYHLEPANPDYAYNLAVGLEHVTQSRLALGFYRRAVQLATAGARVNFSLAQAKERIVTLASRVE